MPRSKPGMKSYPLAMPEELKKTMENLAEKHNRSLNGEILEALGWWIKMEGVSANDLEGLHVPNAGMSGEQLAHYLTSIVKTFERPATGGAAPKMKKPEESSGH